MKMALPLPRDARLDVVVQHNDDVVEIIGTPEALRAGRVGMAHGPIVVAVCRSVAPTVVAANWPHRQPCQGTLHAIRAVEHAEHAASGRLV